MWGAVPRTLVQARLPMRCQPRVGDTGRRLGRARRPSPRTTPRIRRRRSFLRLRQRRARLWKARTIPTSRHTYDRLWRPPLPSQPRMSRTRPCQARHAWLRRVRRHLLRRVSTSRTNRYRNVRIERKNRFSLLLKLARVLTRRRVARTSTPHHLRATVSVPVHKFQVSQRTRGRHLAQRQGTRALMNVLVLRIQTSRTETCPQRRPAVLKAGPRHPTQATWQ